MYDVSRFKVVYSDKVLNALAITDVYYEEKGYPWAGASEHFFKPTQITVLAINADGNIVAISDEAWRFQFLPTVSGA